MTTVIDVSFVLVAYAVTVTAIATATATAIVVDIVEQAHVGSFGDLGWMNLRGREVIMTL